MAQKKEVYKEKIKQVGNWKYTDVYEMLFSWLKNSGYKVTENDYTEKLQGNGKEILIKWTASRKVTDYFKYQITLDWHILGMTDTEAEIGGRKTKTNKGEIAIEFKGNIINDYEKRWENHQFWKFLRGIYENYIIRSSVDEYENDLEDDVRDIIKDFKAFLRIPSQ
ncbi:MAG: hypothetical protein KJ592_01300 [Nanoarchaeota archaeon]|nr:hypothetical protein [Nanoarchaeota archaeon]